MPETPFSTLPLSESPYLSRVSGNYTEKNYYMLAFNPGYALQAAELNEVQELFYLNQSLSLRYSNVWLSRGYIRPGFWEGVVPYDPNYVSLIISSISINTMRFTVNVSKGWYLWTDITSKLNFWIYNDTDYTNLEFDTTQGNTDYLGFFIKKNTVKCCQSNPCPDEQDQTLRDNFMEFTCGASRLGIEKRSDLAIRTDPEATDDDYQFYPLLQVGAPTGIAITRFYNDQNVRTITNE